MNVQAYIEKMKNLQALLLKYVDEGEDTEANYQAIIKYLVDQKIVETRHEFKVFISLLSRIAENHHRGQDFLNKILQIIQFYQDKIKQTFSNSELRSLFDKNNRILIYLMKEQMFDYSIYKKKYYTRKERYSYYHEVSEKISNDEFEVGISLGESDDYICKLIREDSVEEFISYIHKNNIPMTAKIQKSIYETNSFLNNLYLDRNEITLIEYASFFGSINIIKYLAINGVDLNPSLWILAIHGRNPELIQFLEEKNVEPNDQTYFECFQEAIKCHHNELVEYFECNYLQNDDKLSQTIIKLKYFNFDNLDIQSIDEKVLYLCCRLGYFPFVEMIIKNCNDKSILNLREKVERPNNSKEQTLIDVAIDKEQFEIVKFLLLIDEVDINLESKKQKEFEAYNRTPLFIATQKENIEAIKLIVSNNKLNINETNSLVDKDYLDHNCDKMTPFHLAIKNDKIEILKILLSSNNIDVNMNFINDFNSTDEAGCNCKTEIPPLYLAVEKGNIEIIKLLLLRNEINVNLSKYHKYKSHGIGNCCDEYKCNPLQYAVKEKKIEIIKLLLSSKNIDVNAFTFNYEKDTNHSQQRNEKERFFDIEQIFYILFKMTF